MYVCAGEAEQMCYSDNSFIITVVGREEVIKKTDGNIVRKGRIWKENRNEGVRVLSRDDFSDLH